MKNPFSTLRRKLTTPSGPTFTPLPPGGADGSIARLQSFHFHSAILPDDREVTIYLPVAYDEDPTRRFPVLYLHDGQNLIDPHASYLPGRTWRAGSTADATTAQDLTQPIILVGIANTGFRRMAEYTPTRDPRLGGGQGSLYGGLLLTELKPFIDRTFRTLPDAANTGLGGSSLGGLITLFLGFQHPHVFGRLAVLSPSIWWNQRAILSYITATHPHPRPRIWLDIGTAEGAHHVRDTRLLNRTLVALGWQPDRDLKLLVVEGAVHDEDAWAARFDQVLTFLFPAKEQNPEPADSAK